VAVKQVSAESAVAPNLVPMVDIMFLLLLFLMVVSDQSQRELEEVKLPQAKSVQEDKPDVDTTKIDNQRLTINVYHGPEITCDNYDKGLCRDDRHWRIGIKGEDFNETAALEAKLTQLVEIDREKRGENVKVEAGKPKPPSEMKVMIRGDGAALYSHVQRAMNACGTVGIYKIEIGAAEKKD
jgi:biopolymer transport protein ExbD